KEPSAWQVGRVHLELKFIDKPQITLLPDQKIILNKASLLLERDKPVTIAANLRLFNQPVKLLFDFTKEILGIGFVMVKPIKLGSLIKSLGKSKFGDISFRNINF